MEIIKKFLSFKVIQPRMPTSFEFLSTYRNQNFSLPNSIIYYIARNPKSSKSYQKWIKVCKYFFVKNPILCINSLSFGEKLPEKILATKSNVKIWITGGFSVLPFLPNETYQKLFSSILPKIYYKSEILRLSLFDISLTFDEFIFLSSFAKQIKLNNVSIKYNNGKDVKLEKIVEISSNAKHFEYSFSSNPSKFSSKTVQNLIKIPHFLTMKIFRLKNIPHTFDVKPLIQFLKTTNIYVTFEFSKFLSEEYRNQLNEIIFEILETDAFIYGPPSLTIPGIESETQMALLKKARKVND